MEEMTMKRDDLSWMIGGAQGSGVDTPASIFAKAVATAGYHVYGTREYYSNIKGEHSYFQVRFGKRFLMSHVKPMALRASLGDEDDQRDVRGRLVRPPLLPEGGAHRRNPQAVQVQAEGRRDERRRGRRDVRLCCQEFPRELRVQARTGRAQLQAHPHQGEQRHWDRKDCRGLQAADILSNHPGQ